MRNYHLFVNGLHADEHLVIDGRNTVDLVDSPRESMRPQHQTGESSSPQKDVGDSLQVVR